MGVLESDHVKAELLREMGEDCYASCKIHKHRLEELHNSCTGLYPVACAAWSAGCRAILAFSVYGVDFWNLDLF